eukprot:5250355-Pleurochrysis_carterae.AAC.1
MGSGHSSMFKRVLKPECNISITATKHGFRYRHLRAKNSPRQRSSQAVKKSVDCLAAVSIIQMTKHGQ